MKKLSQMPTLWAMSKGFLPQAIQRKVKGSKGGAIPGLGYLAWKSGARTPLAQASRDLFESLPGSQRHVDASRWLSEKVHPAGAYREFRNVFGPKLDYLIPYSQQLTYSHPGTKYWRQLAPRTWAARQSRQGKPMGPAPGFAIPGAVWEQGRREAQQRMFGEPAKMRQAVRMGREPIFQDWKEYLQQLLRGKKDLDAKKLFRTFAKRILGREFA